MAARALLREVSARTMSSQPPNSPLGAFLAALREAEIDCILIGNMAAVRQGAPLMTIDYDFWVGQFEAYHFDPGWVSLSDR